MNNRINEAKVGDIIVDNLSYSHHFYLIIKIFNNTSEIYDDYYDKICLVFSTNIYDNISELFLVKNDEHIILLKI